MPIVHAEDAVVHDLHGARFTSYAAPSRGSQELCAWRLDVPPGTPGQPHTVTREEVVFVLSGTLHVSLSPGPAGIDAAQAEPSRPGDAVVIPRGSTLRVANLGTEPASAWVTTSAGLEAVLPDGTRLTPPWTR
jgi:quercetin dioxygenase-like cupin family protein